MLTKGQYDLLKELKELAEYNFEYRAILSSNKEKRVDYKQLALKLYKHHDLYPSYIFPIDDFDIENNNIYSSSSLNNKNINSIKDYLRKIGLFEYLEYYQPIYFGITPYGYEEISKYEQEEIKNGAIYQECLNKAHKKVRIISIIFYIIVLILSLLASALIIIFTLKFKGEQHPVTWQLLYTLIPIVISIILTLLKIIFVRDVQYYTNKYLEKSKNSL